jgi:hypothetical protein
MMDSKPDPVIPDTNSKSSFTFKRKLYRGQGKGQSAIRKDDVSLAHDVRLGFHLIVILTDDSLAHVDVIKGNRERSVYVHMKRLKRWNGKVKLCILEARQPLRQVYANCYARVHHTCGCWWQIGKNLNSEAKKERGRAKERTGLAFLLWAKGKARNNQQ